VSDAVTMAGRNLRMTRRNTDALLTSLLLPVLLMLLFVYLFGGAIQTGTRYVTYVVPGVLLLCAGFGASMTAVSVTTDMGGGIVDRFRSMDVGGSSVLAGHVAASVVRNLASTALVFGVAFLIGFRPSAGPLDWLAAVGVLLLFILAISWLAAVVGLLARSPEAAGGFSFLVMFLPYPSSAFVPIDTMPSWLHGFAGNQPVTPVIETMRGLLLGLPVGASPWKAVAWCLGILVASVAVSGVLFRRRTA
jgi:ABC-2 type transport system permease protein